MSEEVISTDGRTITETDLVFFSYFSGDWAYLHTDAVLAAKSPFKSRITHGYLTLSVSLGLVVRKTGIDPERFIALRSIRNVNFYLPVRIGDTLHVDFTIERVEKGGNRIETTIRGRTINHRNETVMEFETVHLENKLAGDSSL
ncbi:MAG: dehydratase [Candidatus Thermoplasmatota archaeon]|nr:dehydratase [Candidatus Thermoplasmatota archaeon]